jgi:hypothetical protein
MSSGGGEGAGAGAEGGACGAEGFCWPLAGLCPLSFCAQLVASASVTIIRTRIPCCFLHPPSLGNDNSISWFENDVLAGLSLDQPFVVHRNFLLHAVLGAQYIDTFGVGKLSKAGVRQRL